MKNKYFLLIIIILITILLIGCSNKEKTEESPYLKYIVTTYSGGKEIEQFEVYSNMQTYFRKDSVLIYDSPKEEILILYSTLDYKVEEIQ